MGGDIIGRSEVDRLVNHTPVENALIQLSWSKGDHVARVVDKLGHSAPRNSTPMNCGMLDHLVLQTENLVLDNLFKLRQVSLSADATMCD